jgi:hypothetical protein
MARIRQNGEGSVYQRASDGRWIGSVTLGWDDGKRVRKTVSAKTAARFGKSFARDETSLILGFRWMTTTSPSTSSSIGGSRT